MKLNYSSSLLTSIYLHIIFIHIIYTHLCLAATEPITNNDPHRQDIVYQENSETVKRNFEDQVKAQLLKVLGLKEVPKKGKHQVYVSHALLETYAKARESVREVIPDDRDFYGKINIDDLDDHQNTQELIGHFIRKHGGKDVPVNMITETESIGHKFLFKRDVNQISQVHCQDKPEEVPPAIAHSLPPTLRTKESSRQFYSVHLKFNLSQELFTRPLSADDLEGAELHLGREAWYECGSNDESINSTPNSGSSQKSNNLSNEGANGDYSAVSQTGNKPCNGPRHQRIYILSVAGYDQHNEPITRVYDSRILDTIESSEIMFDIKDIVQSWIEKPESNHGIIVRVSYDEEELKNLRFMIAKSTGLNDPTNASLVNIIDEQLGKTGLQDHVRLKRDFRSYSESEEIWSKKKPTIFLFSDPPGKRHVKRDSVGRNQVKSQASTSSNSQKKRRKNSRANEKCSMKSLPINFDDVGWSDWIIAPAAYYANYCSGDCSHPLLDAQNATNHAIIQSIFHSVGRVVPRSCCAPTRLGRMAILFQLDGSVQMRTYDDMIAEACGCL